jgi:16S rRNA (uracil1498-N3)-methyltransferase
MVVMQHYFPLTKTESTFIFTNNDKHHILNVLRLRSNDEIVVIYQGKQFLCRLVIKGNDIQTVILDQKDLKNELNSSITLIYALPRLEKFELVLQKAVELGVSKVVPFKSERSIVKLESVKFDAKLVRWNRIIKEASEQTRRASLLEIVTPISVNELSNYTSDLNILADENLANTGTIILKKLLEKKDKTISILVGPEGGFSLTEISAFKDLGYKSVSLGKRILRSETAAIYLMSVISFMIESDK